MFQGNFKGVPRKFLERLKEVSRVFQECFKEDKGFSMGGLSGFQRCLKAVF